MTLKLKNNMALQLLAASLPFSFIYKKNLGYAFPSIASK
jgi:hypothetical protein